MDGDFLQKEVPGYFAIIGTGLGLLALHTSHALSEEETIVTVVTGVLIPGVLALGLLASAVWLFRTSYGGAEVTRVAAWCVFGLVILALGSISTIVYQQAEGVEMSHKLFVITNAGTVGASVGFIIGIYDVRGRRATDQIREERERIAQLNNRLSVLNRTLRHDLRNNANIILGYLEILQDSDSPDQRYLDIIRDRTDELVALGERARSLQEIIKLSTHEAEIMDIVAIIEAKVEELQAEHDSITVLRNLPEEQFVRASPTLDIAIGELLSNAVEHNDEESIRIRVHVARTTDQGDEMVEIRIQDNGPGVPEGELDLLRAEYETPLDHSEGIGLWTVNWIVSESGGELQISSTEGEGSEVTLLLHPSESQDQEFQTASHHSHSDG